MTNSRGAWAATDLGHVTVLVHLRTYFPEYFCDDKILLDSTDKAYEYFKVIFHKNLREIHDTKEEYNWVFSSDANMNSLYNLLDFITQNSNSEFVMGMLFGGSSTAGRRLCRNASMSWGVNPSSDALVLSWSIAVAPRLCD
jgi:hypothetical protein